MSSTRPNTPLRLLLLSLAAALLLLAVGLVGDGGETAQAGTAVGPDVTVARLGSTSNYGAVAGIRGYSVGTTSCNVGDEPVWWCNDVGDPYCETKQHPVIAQNLYRLKDGRFEQLGLSWLKHGFASTNSINSDCGTCQSPPHGGDQLGIGCTDTYSSGLNGIRPLGLRSEVNAATGEFPYPYTPVSASSSIDQRIQVAEADLDPTLNAGARFWVEGHYIAADDAEAGNGLNNASHREVTVDAGTFDLNFAGDIVREVPAVFAWAAADPQVKVVAVDVPGSNPLERFWVARKVTGAGPSWHYEYAVQNFNSDRSAGSFTVHFPGSTAFSSAGFHDVEHHSGEPYATTDWTNSSGGGDISWATDSFAVDPNANALRWSTMFNFYFDADRSPAGLSHTLGLFKPGTPMEIGFAFNEEIFFDGFESGDTSSWSLVVP